MDSSLAKYLPLTQSTTYILLALAEPLHGYALMQKVDEMSQGTVKSVFAAGTPTTAALAPRIYCRGD